MSKTVVAEDGTEEVLYTKEELDAIAKERDDARAAAEEAERIKKEKLDEFLKGKTAHELEKTAATTAAEEAKKMAEESLARSKAMEEKAMLKIKGAEMQRYVGTDAALKAELESAYAVLSGMPETTDEEIAARMLAAANMKGFNGPKATVGPTMGSGYAPKFTSPEEREKDTDYQKFVGALGMQEFIPKKEK